LPCAGEAELGSQHGDEARLVPPGSKFVHIHREPYTGFRASRQLYERVTGMVGLQHPDRERLDERVLRDYRTMYEAFFEDRSLIPNGRYHEVCFEDLERDPLGQMKGFTKR
jgi:omega-hydroxy-beta-dihydromenaquinone-9 sulfotransferase